MSDISNMINSRCNSPASGDSERISTQASSKFARAARVVLMLCLVLLPVFATGCAMLGKDSRIPDPRKLLTEPITRNKRNEDSSRRWFPRLFSKKDPDPPKTIDDFLKLRRVGP